MNKEKGFWGRTLKSLFTNQLYKVGILNKKLINPLFIINKNVV